MLYQNLFDGLRDRFDIGVYSLNHDTVVLNALPDFFTGFDGNTGDFQSAEVHSGREWSFLYRLHGNAHFNLKKGVGKHFLIAKPLIEWKRDINDSKGFTDVSTSSLDSLQLGNDGLKVVLTTLVAGGWKLDQIQAEPFQTY